MSGIRAYALAYFLPRLEYVEGSGEGVALNFPLWEFIAAMIDRLSSDPNLIGGGYAAPCARGVSCGWAGRIAGDFFGLAGAVLALGLGQVEGGGGHVPGSRRFLENRRNALVSGPRLGHVARAHVARIGQGAENAALSSRATQIANLTLPGIDRRRVGSSDGLAGAPRGGVPPFGARLCPQAPRVWREPDAENFPGKPGLPAECMTRFGARKTSRPQLGSGVRVVYRREDLAAAGAKSCRNAMGRGEMLAHRPIGAGEAANLTPLERGVNPELADG